MDGAYKTYWTTASLAAGSYIYANNTSIGSLSAGTHTITITTDATGAIAESNESDNSYTKTITVSSPSFPNLTPYQPSGWSDKIVVARTTGTTTDSTGLTTADTLYVNWAVINNGSAAANGTFYTYLYVDGAYKTSWSTASLSAGSYIYANNTSIGSLSAGTHTITITTDATGAIAESNESDNSYTKTITVSNPAQPNLTPYQPSGWSDKIVVARTASSTTDSTSLTTADTLYVNAAVINNGTAATAINFQNALFVDGVEATYWVTAAPFNVNYDSYLTTGYSIGQLTAGTHTIKVTADYGGVIAESNEGDNSYTKTISVSAALPDLVIQSITATPSTFHAGDTINVSCVVSNQGNASAIQTSTQLRFNQTAARPIGYENILTNFTTIAMGAGSAVVLNGQVTIPSSATPGTWYIWGIADNGAVLTQSGGDNDFTRSDPLTVVTVAGQPNLTPYQPSGWSDKIIVARTASSTTDSSSLTTADTLYVNAAVINNGTAATAINFQNALFVDGVEATYWVTTAPFNVNYDSYLTTGYSIGQLSAGTHTITITADYGGVIAESNEGDNSYTKTISVGSSQGSSVSSSLSTLTATPSSAAADGQSIITAKVTLRDGNNNPVSGKNVQIHSGGSVTITPPASPTDANGQATATITATTAVTSSIWVVDTADSVIIQQQPTIQFTQRALQPPDSILAGSIGTLYQETANILTGSTAYGSSTTPLFSVLPIPLLAPDEGLAGDYFEDQAGAAEADAIVDFAFSSVGILGAAGDALKAIPESVAGTLAQDIGFDIGSKGDAGLAHWIAGNDNGLSKQAKATIETATSYQQTLHTQETALLSGIPPISSSQETAYINDLQKRLYANYVLDTAMQQELTLLDNLQTVSLDASENDFNNTIILDTAEVGGDLIIIGFTEGAASPLVLATLAEGGFSEWQNYQSFSANQRAYLLAFSSMQTCGAYIDQMHRNVCSGYSQISQGVQPNPVTGGILDIQPTIQCNLASLPTTPSSVFQPIADSTTPFEYISTPMSAGSSLTLLNTSSSAATFEVFTLYSAESSIFGENTDVPLLNVTAINLEANHSGTITVNYLNDPYGSRPAEGSIVSMYVVG